MQYFGFWEDRPFWRASRSSRSRDGGGPYSSNGPLAGGLRLTLLDQPFTLRRSGSLLRLAGLSCLAFVLGLVACYASFAVPVGLIVNWKPRAGDFRKRGHRLCSDRDELHLVTVDRHAVVKTGQRAGR